MTTGKAAEREMRAMERRVAAAKPQRKDAGGPVSGPWQTPPVPFTPLPTKPAPITAAGPNFAALRASTVPMPLKTPSVKMPLKSLDPYANAKDGGRQPKKRGR